MHDCHQHSLQLTDRLPTSHARSIIPSKYQQSFLLLPIDSRAVSCSGFGGNSARTRTRLCLLWLLDEEQLVATHDKERDLSIFWLIRFIFLGFASEENVEACQEFRGLPQIEAVHNLRKVRMYLNVLSLRSTSLEESRKGNLKKNKKIYSDFLVGNL